VTPIAERRVKRPVRHPISLLPRNVADGKIRALPAGRDLYLGL
jgi:hypothetical protein